MNITFVAHHLDKNHGSSISLDQLARELSVREHRVRVLTTNLFKQNKLPDQFPYELLSNQLAYQKRYAAPFRLNRLLNEYDAITDIFHVFTPEYLPIAGGYRISSDTAVVGRLNSYEGFCTNPTMISDSCYENCTLSKKIIHDNRPRSDKLQQIPEYLYKHSNSYLINQLDKIFAISPQMRDVYVHNGVDPDLINVIPNFYEPDFADTPPDGDREDSHGFDILYAGRLRVEKGVDVLIDSAAMLEHPDVSVHVVGNGEESEALKQRARSNGTDGIVHFHGQVDHENLSKFYLKSDIFVHPCRWPEPFGRTILEALQCNCPPVVSDIGAGPWIVGDAGRMFSRNDSESLARVLNELIESPDELSNLAANCRSRIKAFTPTDIVDTIEQNYINALQ